MMMNLQREWQNMGAELELQSEKSSLSNILIDKQSHSLLQSLLFKLKWKLRWIRIIDIPLLAAAFFTSGHLQILLLAVFFSYEIFHGIGMRQFNKIKTGVDYTANTLEVLKKNLSAVTAILKIENLWGWFLLPLSGPTGMLAFLLYKYENIQTVIASPHFLLKMLLMALAGIPLIFLAKKMNDSIFKAPILELKTKINSLENEM